MGDWLSKIMSGLGMGTSSGILGPVMGQSASTAPATVGGAAGSAQMASVATAAANKANIAGSLMASFSNVANMFDVKNSTLNPSQKKMATADSAVGAVAGVADAFIPGLGTGINLLNTIGGSMMKTPNSFKKYSINNDVTSSGAFGGTADGAMKVGDDITSYKGSGLAGKLFGKKGISSDLGKSQTQQSAASGVLKESMNAKSNMGSADLFSTRTNVAQSGMDYNAIKYGSKGMKLNKDMQFLIKKAEMFKSGGSIVAKNVIVNGALHAHKHTLKELEDYKDVEMTHKGVPVITKSHGGEITQHAEVEKDEIILHISLTEKLEKLRKIGTEEAMIEAGKLLSKELVKNTIDSKSKLLK